MQFIKMKKLLKCTPYKSQNRTFDNILNHGYDIRKKIEVTNVSKAYFDLPSRLEDGFSEIDSDIVMNLHDTNEEYADMMQQISDLKKQHPFIDKVMEGAGEIHLTDEEHAVLIRYFNLTRKMENMERLQIYFRGHTDAVAYLKKIKVI